MSERIAHTEYGPPDGRNYEAHWHDGHFELFLASDVGLKRKNNEDSCIFTAPEEREEAEQWGNLIAVADGMGGALAGEHASRLALHILVDTFYDKKDALVPQALRFAVEEANARIFNEAQQNPEYSGMGTTLSCVVLRGDWIYAAQVGDSRIYLARGGTLHQISRDHSVVAEQVRNGMITEEEARTHPLSNLITRAVGIKEEVQVDTFAFQARQGDTVLLCSDGLSGMVPDMHIGPLMANSGLNEAAHGLIEKALQGGGSDNVTVALLRLTAPPPPRDLHEGAEIFHPPSAGWFERLMNWIS